MKNAIPNSGMIEWYEHEARTDQRDMILLYLIDPALRGIEWVELAFPDVNMHVHMNVNVNVPVPEEVWSHTLKAKFRKHTSTFCDVEHNRK